MSTSEVVGEESGARRKIVDAAIVLFANKGLHGTSTRDIAKESGVNLSLISYYFGGKEALYETLIQEFVLAVFRRIAQVADDFAKEKVCAQSTHKAIMAIVDTLVDMRVTNPHIVKIMTREKLAGLPFSREIHETMITQAGQKIEGIIARGQQAGVVNPKVNPRFFISCLVEGIMGYFNMLDCNCSWNQGLYGMPEQRSEFKEQISMLYLEGIFK